MPKHWYLMMFILVIAVISNIYIISKDGVVFSSDSMVYKLGAPEEENMSINEIDSSVISEENVSDVTQEVTKGNQEIEEVESTENVENTVQTLNMREIYGQNCLSCHGEDLSGVPGYSLRDVGSRFTEEEIKAIITNGRGAMPAFDYLEEWQKDEIAAWLSLEMEN